MDVLELASGQDVVLDVGHSGAITGIARYQDLVISGGRDGFLYVRRSDGRSVIPPVHLQEITCVAMPADIDVAVVGANDKVFGVDLETGTKSPLAGFDGVSPIAAASIGDVVLVGCSDGSLRTVSVENGTVTVSAGGGAAVLAVASHGRFAAVSYADGAVRLLDHDCTEVWSAKLRRSEAEQLAVAADGTVVAAGTGRPSDDGTFPGTLVRLGAAGAVEARTVLPSGMVSAATLDGDAVIVAISDGSVHRLGIALEASLGENTRLGQFPDGVTQLVMLDGEVWVGTNGGGVSRLTPNLVLPSVSSGMFSLGMSSDERRAVATDGKRVVVWDLTTGKELASLDTQGGTSQPARAVTFVGEDTEDVVIALFDGTLERRTVTALTEVAAASEPLADCPHTLGSLGPLVVAFTGFASPAKPTGALLVNPADFGSIQPNTDAGVDVTAMRRVGYWFAGTGELEGTRMAVIAREHLVVQHGRLLTVTPGAREWVRIAKDEQFIR